MELRPDGRTVVIQHEAISNYMAAMTMPFKVKTAGALADLQKGDEISFQLHVAETESWVDQIVKTGTASPPPPTAWTNLPVTRPAQGREGLLGAEGALGQHPGAAVRREDGEGNRG